MAVFFKLTSLLCVVDSRCQGETYRVALTAFIRGGLYLWVARTVFHLAFQNIDSFLHLLKSEVLKNTLNSERVR